ncbi:MAG: hypothetical protein DRR06_16245 [Gammaproteobacteria bacterium]|nr:MAG: hypothetical protein DRR06_16245 [Gammaproteobacteria bacterium]
MNNQVFIRALALSLVSVSTLGCAVHPVEYPITLEETAIISVSNLELWPEQHPAKTEHLYDVIKIDIVTPINIYRFYEERGLDIQVRCTVEGDPTMKKYIEFGVGPFFQGVDISNSLEIKKLGINGAKDSSGDGSYRYTIYAFFDLRVENDLQYAREKSAQYFDLRKEEFNRMGCYVLGVSMWPVFPRSTTVYITQETFSEMLRIYESERVSPNKRLQFDAATPRD